MNDKISIIIPVYNVEPYLKACLDSVINQTYKNLEIILIDDGSPDNCPTICDEYALKDNRIKVIHKENGGLSSARNTGLDICNGDYISFVDSDDVISHDFIYSLYKAIIDNKSDISECNFIRFNTNEESELVNPKEDVEVDITNYKNYSSRDMQLALFGDDSVQHVVVWNKLYKRDIYINLRFPEGKIHEDEYTTYMAFAKSSLITHIDKQLYFYRITNSSITGSLFNIKRLDKLDAYEQVKEYYKDDSELFNMAVIKYQDLLKVYFFCTKRYIKNNRKYVKDIKRRIRINTKDYKKCNVSFANIVKSYIIGYFGNTYFVLTMIKDFFARSF